MKTFKGIILLCEGRTDVAYIRKLLQLDNYRDYKEVVSDMVKPLDSFFENYLSGFDYVSGEILNRPILPIILRRTHGLKDDFALIYSMDGMNKTSNYRYVIEKYTKLTNASQSDFGGDDDLPEVKVAMAILYDMDKSTVKERVQFVKDNLGESINEIQYLSDTNLITNSSFFNCIGLHIIKAPDKATGNLEDILLQFISSHERLDAAKKFLDDSNFERGTQDKKESDFNKSLISILGQIEVSGVDNSTIISKSSLFNQDLKSEAEGRRLLDFINELRKNLYK